MTQPHISNDCLPSTDAMDAEGRLVADNIGLSKLPTDQQPAIIHPNFDPKQTPVDPARSLSDIPEPARRENSQLRRLYGKSSRFQQSANEHLSKWTLVASEPFAEHLALLSAAKLIKLPDSFYQNYRHHNSRNRTSEQTLLTSIETMQLLDMADIQTAISAYPKLTRFGFLAAETTLKTTKLTASAVSDNATATLRSLVKRHNADELLNSLYADDWQVILQPQDFETGSGSLVTDLMACSVAVHALKQCSTRKTINKRYSAARLCQYVRSYLLSQLGSAPASRRHYRQIRLFSGHIIVAAHYLGWDIQVDNDGDCYFNISSRCALLTRYANMQDYAINGWSM